MVVVFPCEKTTTIILHVIQPRTRTLINREVSYKTFQTLCYTNVKHYTTKVMLSTSILLKDKNYKQCL